MDNKNHQNTFEIVSFYKFINLKQKNLHKVRESLLKTREAENIRGLILLSTEGINISLSGASPNIPRFLNKIQILMDAKDFLYKKSPSPIWGFKKLRIKIKDEIISIGKPEQNPLADFYSLEPEEWETMLNEQANTILDVRNDYEVQLGSFKNAKILPMKEFREFPKKLKDLQLPKEKKTLIYCTGGIRCEKALTEMHTQGFKEVYLLKGGILHYLKKLPNKSFQGECFVFDHRVAVNQHRQVSQKYKLCPHCGQAADLKMECSHCSQPAQICKICFDKKLDHLRTCSKNCAHHTQMGHKFKKQSSINQIPKVPQ